MAADDDPLGYLPCPWCRDLWHRESFLTVKLNRRGKIFAVCEGGPSGNDISCGQGNNLHARHSARLKAMLATAARTEPAESTPSTETENGNETDPAGEPAIEPAADPAGGFSLAEQIFGRGRAG